MKLYTSLESVTKKEKISLAIGNFDGFHLGHHEIVKKCKKNDGIPTILTFDIHPREYLYPDFSPKLITFKHEKYSFFKHSGIEAVIELPFSEYHSIDPLKFLDKLNTNLSLDSITIGFNFFFGQNQKGNSDLIFWWGRSSGVKINVVPPVLKNGIRISSTVVRELILSGNISNANTFLTYPFVISGTVKEGRQIGKTIHFPTLNIDIPRKITPPDGVYITQTLFDNYQKMSLTNIGTNPTFDFDTTDRNIETWIVDENLEEMYGKKITVYFLKKVRDEIRFSSKEKLSEMILNDRAAFHEFNKLNESRMLPSVF